MTRVIKNKAVVPKDYSVCVGGHSYNPGLSMDNTTTHDMGTDLQVAPFDFVYEGGYNYAAVSDTVDLGWGRPAVGDEVNIIYKITFNIVPQKQLRFFRFIITPNVDIHLSKSGALYPNDYTTPCINLTFIKCNANGTVTSTTNNITIEFDEYNPSARIVGGDTVTNRYYRSKTYSIIYDVLENKIYDDTENGVDFWGEIQTAEASENGVMTTSLDDEATPAADIPSFDFGDNTHYNFIGARIDKAIVPQDYARLIHTVEDATSIISINTVTHDLTSINVSSLPNYDMVGEIECVYPSGAMKSINGTGNRIYYITRKFNLNPELVNKYRLIRLIVQPNINLLVSTGPITLYFQVQYVIDGVSYSNNILLANRLTAGNRISTGTNKYAFIFDTKTQEFYNDTSNGIGLWSSIYNFVMVDRPQVQ
jgi:hypothetical protein